MSMDFVGEPCLDFFEFSSFDLGIEIRNILLAIMRELRRCRRTQQVCGKVANCKCLPSNLRRIARAAAAAALTKSD